MQSSSPSFASMRSSVRSRPAPSHAHTSNSEDPEEFVDDPAAHGLPTRPSDDIPTRYLQASIDAYRRGDHVTGERSLSDAWRACLPAVRSTIAGRIREHDRRDDAEQGAFLKTWRAVQNYNPDRGPVRSAEAFFRWAADKASLNVVELRDRIAGREQSALDDDAMRDIVEYRADRDTRTAGMDDTKAMADYARLAQERAGGVDRGRIWAAIVFAVDAGHVERAAIAEYVSNAIGRDVPEVSIRREIFHMVRELPHPRDAISKVERIVDWRTVTVLEADCGQSALFDFEWQEIS